MKNLYLKPILIGALCGALLLLIDLLAIFGPGLVSDAGHPDGKDLVKDPLATPTPTRDDTGFLILLLLIHYILMPLLIAVAGAVSVKLSPADVTSPSKVLIVSAIPGAVSMLLLTSILVISSITGIAPGSHGQGILWFLLIAMVTYLAIGTVCSAAGGIIYGIVSGRLEKNTQAVNL